MKNTSLNVGIDIGGTWGSFIGLFFLDYALLDGMFTWLSTTIITPSVTRYGE